MSFRVIPWLIGFHRRLSAAKSVLDLICVYLRSSAADLISLIQLAPQAVEQFQRFLGRQRIGISLF
jgi:hypothetical protein